MAYRDSTIIGTDAPLQVLATLLIITAGKSVAAYVIVRVGIELQRSGRPFVVLEMQDDPAHAARKAGLPVLIGDAAAPAVLRDTGIERATLPSRRTTERVAGGTDHRSRESAQPELEGRGERLCATRGSALARPWRR